MTSRKMTDAELDAAFAAAMASAGPGPMKEHELQATIVGLAEQLGLRVFRASRSDRGGVRGGGRGWPDLVIAGEHGVLFRECKSGDGVTSVHQDWWGWYLHNAGYDFGVWRPADWKSGRIRSELEAIR